MDDQQRILIQRDEKIKELIGVNTELQRRVMATEDINQLSMNIEMREVDVAEREKNVEVEILEAKLQYMEDINTTLVELLTRALET